MLGLESLATSLCLVSGSSVSALTKYSAWCNCIVVLSGFDSASFSLVIKVTFCSQWIVSLCVLSSYTDTFELIGGAACRQSKRPNC